TNDFDRLRSDVRELQRSSSETRKDVDTVKEKTTGVVKEDSLLSMRESQTDILARVNENSRGLQELRGRFDESRYFTEKTFKETSSEREVLKSQVSALEAQVRSLKDRLAVLEGQPTSKGQQPETSGATQQTAETPKTNGAPKDARVEPPADNMTAAYDAAYQLFKDKKYKESRTKFEAFLKEYPKSERADNAQFWIAESYYADKDFESAILSYETLLKKYPNSSKASGGMLKQGYAFIEIGDLKTGRIILHKLTEKYAGSKEAELAKKKITELDKKPPKKK
ncbi:MAG TPA: tol-pal system protein YbgF, partial [Thermodesulfovibrionales bacterium]|nr:tol-pal system protein YbgF [Thermodesulfovibrionales bacterium]